MTMATACPTEFEFLEEGFTARDIVEQKINESSMTVRSFCSHCFKNTDKVWPVM